MKTRLLAALPSALDQERFETLLERPGLRIERIVSCGQASPADFWYDQDEGEWVLLLSGAARLRLAEPEEVIELQPGDALHLPPHRRHRVEWTQENQPSVWLAVFYPPEQTAGIPPL